MLIFNRLVINLNVQGRKFNGDPPLGLSTGIGGKKLLIPKFVAKCKFRAHSLAPKKEMWVRALRWDMMNSQIKIQSEINLHKPKKWTHHDMVLERSHHLLSYNILCDQ